MFRVKTEPIIGRYFALKCAEIEGKQGQKQHSLHKKVNSLGKEKMKTVIGTKEKGD